MSPVPVIRCTQPVPCGKCWYCRQRFPALICTAVDYERGTVTYTSIISEDPYAAGWRSWWHSRKLSP